MRLPLSELKLSSCAYCKALTLTKDADDHETWHEQQQQEGLETLWPAKGELT
jgi:hypothetical protein